MDTKLPSCLGLFAYPLSHLRYQGADLEAALSRTHFLFSPLPPILQVLHKLQSLWSHVTLCIQRWRVVPLLSTNIRIASGPQLPGRQGRGLQPAAPFLTQTEHTAGAHTATCSGRWAVTLKQHQHLHWPSFLNEALWKLWLTSSSVLLGLYFKCTSKIRSLRACSIGTARFKEGWVGMRRVTELGLERWWQISTYTEDVPLGT